MMKADEDREKLAIAVLDVVEDWSGANSTRHSDERHCDLMKKIACKNWAIEFLGMARARLETSDD